MKPVCLFFLGILFLVALPFNKIHAQEFKLTGVLFDNATKNRIVLAEITNKRTKYSVGSNDLGIFLIKAKIGDTLYIVKRDYNDMEVVVTSQKDLMIKLNRGATLNEVVINGQNKKQELDAVAKDFKDKGAFYAGKPPVGLLSPFGGSPLTFLYELFGKTPKNARRFATMHQEELEQTHIDQFYNKTSIQKNTGLDGTALEDFMINYRPPYEKTKNWTTYDGVKWIMDSYKKYKETNKSPL